MTRVACVLAMCVSLGWTEALDDVMRERRERMFHQFDRATLERLLR